MRRFQHQRRSAFTLVELLMVITIIGILAGLIVPAVFSAMRAVKKGALAMEAQTLAQAIEAYKNKYSEYPPDGASAAIFVRHYQKRFPNMLDSEFTALHVAAGRTGSPAGPAPTAPQVMDAAEALVFALGGFSSDPAHPFTGNGGPLALNATVTPSVYEYNTDRNEPLFEFNEAQLTLDNQSGVTWSTDESLYGTGAQDKLPAYHAKGRMAPYAYFDSRSYTFRIGTVVQYNDYGSDTIGYARPYRSDEENTKVPTSNPDGRYRFVNERTFQIIGAGLDDHFGNIASTSSQVRYYRYPSGDSIDFSSNGVTAGPSRFLDSLNDANKYQHDNVANFTEGSIADALPN